MSTDLPGSLRRPGPVAGGLIMLTVWMLPAEHRTRYEDEFRAELVDVPIARRVRHAVGLLVGSVALRRALADTGAASVVAGGRDWRCRLRRHRWTLIGDTNPENRRAMQLSCIRCGRVEDIDEYEPPNRNMFIAL